MARRRPGLRRLWRRPTAGCQKEAQSR